MAPHRDERELVRRAKQGDTDALNQLCEMARVAAYAFALKNLRDVDLAEDCVQHCLEGFLRAFKDHYDPEQGTVAQYVCGACRNRIADIRKDLAKSPLIVDPVVLDTRLQQDWRSSLEELQRAQVLHAFAEAMMKHGGAPHQVIAAGFNHLIAEFSNEPTKIATELGPKLLGPLGLDLGQMYHKEMQARGDFWVLPEEQVSAYFKPLHAKLQRLVRDVLEDRDDLRRYKHLLDKMAAVTLLKDYFSHGEENAKDACGGKGEGRTPPEQISDWALRVKNRVIRWMLRNRDKWDCVA